MSFFVRFIEIDPIWYRSGNHGMAAELVLRDI